MNVTGRVRSVRVAFPYVEDKIHRVGLAPIEGRYETLARDDR